MIRRHVSRFRLHGSLVAYAAIRQEEAVFPKLNEKMDFTHEQEQHKDVHTFLDKFLTAIHAAQKNKAEFDAVKLKELVLSAKDALVYYEL